MKRHIAVLLVVGLVAAVFAPTAEAGKKKKKKPVPVDATYYIVWGGDACALSTTTDAANPDEACSDLFWGLTAPLSEGPAVIPAIDGLPLTLDAAKPIKGKISVQSWYFAGLGPDIMGIGQPELYVKLTGVSGGEEVTLGELTTEPYTVTPASADYVVEFEIQPDAALTGKVLDELTLTMEVQGNSLFHGVFPADGTSTLTMGAFALP